MSHEVDRATMKAYARDFFNRGKTISEISDLLGLSKGTIKRWLWQSRPCLLHWRDGTNVKRATKEDCGRIFETKYPNAYYCRTPDTLFCYKDRDASFIKENWLAYIARSSER